MNAELTAVDVRPRVGGAEIVELCSVGADGAAYAGVGEPLGAVEVWRLRPEVITPQLRRRLEALRRIDAPGLLRIREIALEEPTPYVIVGGERLRWGATDGWGRSAAALRRDLAALASGLGAAHRLDVVHGRLDASCVGVDETGRAVLDLTGLEVRPAPAGPAAPEIERGGSPSAAADVWALAQIAAGTAGAGALASELASMRDPVPERRPVASDVARLLDDDPSAATPRRADEVTLDANDAARFGLPSHLGAYELLEQIGAGGMGRVFRARDVAGGPDVAVKVLLSSWASDPELVARFRREARVLAQIQSPYVARFLAANEDAGFHYLVMELVDATSADALLRERRRLDVDLALAITCDVARALGELHALGLVHRDIKPGNVLVDLSGEVPRVKLCDFGIARPVEPAAEEDQLTRAGAPGTPAYMAPEQIEALAVDARADVYSLGATLYAMLVGRPPFVGNPAVVMMSHLTEEPAPLCDHDPSIPDAISDVVMRCLAKAPDERYRDASELHEALQIAWRGPGATIHALPQPLGVEGAPKVYDFRWTLQADPEELWPHVSNTERLNRAAGLDEVEWSHGPGDGYVRTEGRFRAAGMELRWKENPFEWVAPSRLGVVREYVSGPFEWLRSTVELDRREAGGTQLRHRIEIRPRGIVGRAAAMVEVGLKLRRGLERVYRRIDTACVVARERGGRPGGSEGDPFESPQRADASLRARVEERLERVLERGGDTDAVEALVEHVCTAPGPRLARLRPRAWAREQGLAEGPALSTLLLAASEGVLSLLWDILCPSCRIPSGIEETLRSLESHGRCEVCDLDFELDMARSVELVFRVHPAVRPADLGVYCIGGPAHSPHVLAQVRVAPAERFALDVDLPPGRYAFTGRGLPQRWPFTVDERAPLDQWDLPLRSGMAADVARSLQPGINRIKLTNDLEHEVVVRLERATARDDAFTAADAAASALFRDLFPDQILSPEQLVAISDVALLFAQVTDALDRYEREEAEVHRELMTLSSTVQRAADLEGGALVRLHGDGVVAVFADRVAAVRAALDIASGIAWKGTSFGLALHAGPARMTSIGGQLDYFGKTLHVAEHISRWAEAGEVLVSETLLSDRTIAPMLTARTALGGHLRIGNLLASRLRPASLRQAG